MLSHIAKFPATQRQAELFRQYQALMDTHGYRYDQTNKVIWTKRIAYCAPRQLTGKQFNTIQNAAEYLCPIIASAEFSVRFSALSKPLND